MCAGIGTRLRPLTYTVPKPMVPVANRPVLEYTLELLAGHGIRDIVVNLHFKPEQILGYFGDGSQYGINLKYSVEKKLMGTAGGVKRKEKLFKDDAFLVMSGDGLTDINLTDLLEFHKRSGSEVTMVLKEVNAKLEYGLAATDRKSRVTRFLEKPKWEECFVSDKSTGINTGIYVLEPGILEFIPPGKEFDFAKDLFPILLRKKKKITAYFTDSYWCDIGNIQQYKMSHRDILGGKVRVRLAGERRGQNWVGRGCEIDHSVKLSGPLMIGRRCRIKAGAEICGATVVGNHSFIGKGAIVKNSIIWENAYIGKGVRIENCIIGRNARVTESISVFDGIVQLD